MNSVETGSTIVEVRLVAERKYTGYIIMVAEWSPNVYRMVDEWFSYGCRMVVK